MTIHIAYINRRPRPAGNFSIENLFREVALHLPEEFRYTWREVPCYSNRFLKRVWNTIHASRYQADIKHITGDTNFLTLLLQESQTVLTIHDCVFMNHPNRVYRKLLRLFWLEYPVRHAAAVTVVSEATRKDVLRYSSCPENKIHVVDNCISDRFRPILKMFNASCPVVLQLGTAPNKNVPRMLEALAGLSCHLAIVGRMTDALREMIAKNSIHCSHYEYVSDNELMTLYRDCDLVSLPSISEGFGLPVVEANAVGRAVVTSNISPMREVAGNAACLVDPHDVNSIRDGFRRLIADSDYRHELIENGFRNRERFRPTRIAAQYAKIYSAVYERRINAGAGGFRR